MKLKLKPLLSAVHPRTEHTNIQRWLLPLFRDRSIAKRFKSNASPPKASDPLRILFCGSDEFSCANLRALHAEHVRNPSLVESIDVVVRPGKRVGRGYKKIQHPLLRDVATELGLPIHERDTFTGWDMPAATNLIIAVSFGLFVPRRLLGAAKYGGLNMHPSLLPDLRGPAPLHHTLLRQRPFTGVTLQTLDHHNFDAGTVLAQTHLRNAYRIPDACTVPQLQDALAPLAAEMLVDGLRRGLHVPPHADAGWLPRAESPGPGQDDVLALELDKDAMAPKITPRLRQLLPVWEPDFTRQGVGLPWSADMAALTQRTIGPLWFKAKDHAGHLKRVIVPGDVESITLGAFDEDLVRYRTDLYGVTVSDEEETFRTSAVIFYLPNDDAMYLLESVKSDKTRQGGLRIRALKILTLKVEGERERPARLAFEQFPKVEQKPLKSYKLCI
ncbi:hypothetical protein JX266_004062 [Neoarthrinium moseri]|nr:hypothetical protein JX266_004062 [Neoarthrinium moseri]